MRYVRSQKMKMARHYLQNGCRSHAVAQMLGYINYTTFFRCYITEFGEPPSKISLEQ